MIGTDLRRVVSSVNNALKKIFRDIRENAVFRSPKNHLHQVAFLHLQVYHFLLCPELHNAPIYHTRNALEENEEVEEDENEEEKKAEQERGGRRRRSWWWRWERTSAIFRNEINIQLVAAHRLLYKRSRTYIFTTHTHRIQQFIRSDC